MDEALKQSILKNGCANTRKLTKKEKQLNKKVIAYFDSLNKKGVVK